MKEIESIDFTKFIMSLFVIAFHTLYLVPNEISSIRILLVIFQVAVPFFFITSGYLLFRKVVIPFNKTSEKRMFHYGKRILYLYVLWTIIYLPLAIYGAYIGHVEVKEFLIYSLRKFLFVGESYYSWHLWYLHGLLVALVMIYILLKCKLKPKYILWIGLFVFMCGIGLEKLIQMDYTTLPVLIQKFIHTYVWLFERVRGGIFIGFPYITIGLFLAQYQRQVSWKFSITISIVGILLYYFKVTFGLMLFATGFFLFVLDLKIKSKHAFYYRKSSLLIYLLHMLFVFLYVVCIKHNQQYQCISLFLFVVINCIITSYFILMVAKNFPFIRKLYEP